MGLIVILTFAPLIIFMKKVSISPVFSKKSTTQFSFFPTVLFSLILVFGWNVGWGQTIMSWNFTSNNNPNTNLPGGSAAVSFNTGGTQGSSGCTGNGISINGWNVNEYFQIIAPTTGYNITSISLNGRSSNTGPWKFKFQYSSTGTGGTFSDLGTTFQSTNAGSCANYSADFSAVNALDNNANTVIRIVFTGGEADGTPATGDAAGGGTFRIDDLIISGTAVAAPTPTISSSGTPSALSTTYGTASSNTTFSVSGANMTAGILVTPPAGFEVSTSASSGFATSITVGAAGTIASTTVYVRLAATTVPNSYSGNIVLSSSGASNVNVATVSSSVSTKPLTISGLTGANKVYDATTTASSTGTPSLVGIVGGDVVTISGSPTLTFANATVGTGKTITVSGYTLSGAQAARYTVTQPTGLTGDITAKALTITADNVTKTAGSPLTGGSSTAFSSSGLVGGQTIGSVTIAYGSAGAATGDGATPGV